MFVLVKQTIVLTAAHIIQREQPLLCPSWFWFWFWSPLLWLLLPLFLWSQSMNPPNIRYACCHLSYCWLGSTIPTVVYGSELELELHPALRTQGWSSSAACINSSFVSLCIVEISGLIDAIFWRAFSLRMRCRSMRASRSSCNLVASKWMWFLRISVILLLELILEDASGIIMPAPTTRGAVHKTQSFKTDVRTAMVF